MSVFDSLRRLRPELSASHAKLAALTLDRPAALRDWSSQALAEAAGVGQSSVVKFAQKLGFTGYPAFRQAVIDALDQTASDVSLGADIRMFDPLALVGDKWLTASTQVLTATRQANSPLALERAVLLLKRARQVVVVSAGACVPVASDFARQLQRMGIVTQHSADGYQQQHLLAGLGKDDVLLAVTDAAEAGDVRQWCAQAHSAGAHCISLTIDDDAVAARSADVSLVSIGGQPDQPLAPALLQVSQQFVLHWLAAGLAQMRAHRIGNAG